MALKITAANSMSVIRVLLTPFTYVYVTDCPHKKEVLLAIVLVAIVSDILDGYFARRFKTVSPFGTLLDFTADKMFICTVLVILSSLGELPIWIALVIVNREFWVMGMRLFTMHEGILLPARKSGKLKSLLIFGAIVAHLVDALAFISYPLFLAAVLLTIISLIDYTYFIIKYLRTGKST
jgi:CDP-diacylglycerol--glycerol-3-phosphate 3-phosphatidyltransferase